MQQVPASVWNEIAAAVPIQNPSMATMFQMDQQRLDLTLHVQAQAMEKAGQPDSVITAYQQMAPLLAENQAISQYINQTGNFSLRTALPEVLNPQEAVSIAAQDRPLSKDEQTRLLELLQPLTPETSSNV